MHNKRVKRDTHSRHRGGGQKQITEEKTNTSKYKHVTEETKVVVCQIPITDYWQRM